ncbi:MAG TPA: TonB-dependent receptor [Bryobacteraceae bacterium]|jgi:outer membrane receptor protein involved in Fe transport
MGAASNKLQQVARVALITLSCVAALGQTPDDPTSLESLFQTKIVTASRFAEDLADAPSMMTVVRREDIDRFGGLSLREILNRVSGLNLSTNNFTDRSMITVRGDQTKDTAVHVLFLINGRPTREILEGGVMTELIESFPVNILERIEVIEGPGSVVYGSNAFSGVINLITRKAEGAGGTIRGFSTGAGPSGASAEGWYTRGALSFTAAAQFHQDSNWNTPLQPIGDTTPGNIMFDLHDRSLGVYTDVNYKGFSAMFSVMDFDTPFAILESAGESHWQRIFADIGYDVKPAAHWTTGFHTTYTGTAFDSNANPLVGRKAGEMESDWTNSIDLSTRARITFGALYSYQFGRELETSNGYQFISTDASRPSGGAYAQLEYNLGDTLKLVGGMQLDKVQNIRAHSVPRLGVVWNPATHWYVKALYGKAFRAPSLNETQTLNPTIRGDLALLPELSSTLDFAIVYQGNRLQTTINYFRTEQSHDIQIVNIGLDTYQYQNSGGILFHGYQWETKWYIRPKWLVEGSALYQTNQASSGQSLDLPTPHLSARAGVSYADHHGSTVGLFDVYSGLVAGFASTPNPKPEAYHLITANLRLNLERYFGPAAKRVSLIAHGDNLANRAVWEAAWGYGSISTLPVERGRTIYYGLEISLRRE